MKKQVQVRFYEELNDFLPPGKRKQAMTVDFNGTPSVKDLVESLGVPHTEIDLILVNSRPQSFDYRVADGDFISVYPQFESLDISSLSHLQRPPLRRPAFVLDVHLGKLARRLRLLGFDALYRNDYHDPEIVQISLEQRRIILTRDRGLLKHKAITHGCFVRSDVTDEQLREVLDRFDLNRLIKPFRRCMACNGELSEVDRREILEHLQPKTRRYYRKFWRCRGCGKIYWKGSHYRHMIDYIHRVKTRQI